MDRGWVFWRRWRGGLGWGSGRVVDLGLSWLVQDGGSGTLIEPRAFSGVGEGWSS